MGIAVLFEYNLMLVETAFFVVEDQIGIIVTTSHAYLEMHVVCGGTSGASHKGNGLTCNDLVAGLYQIATIVTVKGGEAVHVAYLYAVAVACKGACHHHGTVEDGAYAVVAEALDVCAGVVASAASAIGTDNFGFLEQVAPVGVGEIL